MVSILQLSLLLRAVYMVGEARFKLTGSSVAEVKQRMKNLLLRISAVVKTLNSEISRYRLADYITEMK